MKKPTRRHDDFYCKKLKKRVKILTSFRPLRTAGLPFMIPEFLWIMIVMVSQKLAVLGSGLTE